MLEEEYDDVVAKRIQEECRGEDVEIGYSHADRILINLLRELGFNKTADAWVVRLTPNSRKEITRS